jgi:PEP-CTERM motif
MKRILIAALTVTATAALAAPASAATTFQGYATGCFTTTTCSPSTTATPGTAMTIGGLTYTTSSVNFLPDHHSFSQSLNSSGQAGFAGTDLGSFSLNNTVFDYNPYVFDLLVTFTAPPGTQAANLTADLIGTVQAEQNGTVRIDFANSAENPLTLTSSVGTFTFYIDDLTLGQSTVGAQTALTGGILSFTPVPEPGTWALMLLGFAGVGAAMRRSRKPALAQLA